MRQPEDRSSRAQPAVGRAWTALTGTVLTALLLRLPWLGPGFGSDPDAYRIAWAALRISEGEYVLSRPPGYPLFEGLVATVVGWGPLATNGLTALFSAAAVLFLALVLRELDAQQPLLIALAFSLVPVVYVNSTATMDYVPAVALVLAATWGALRGRPLAAGAALGLAVGIRLTSGAMLLPLGLWIALREERTRTRDVGAFVVATLLVGLACHLPSLLRYGLDVLTFVEPAGPVGAARVLVRATTGVWGTVGVLGLGAAAGAALLDRDRVRRRLERVSARRALWISGLTVALYLVAFVRLPLESGYLVPAVPFVLLAGAVALPARAVRVACAALILAPFVTVGRSGITLRGPIVAARGERVRTVREARAAVDAARALPDGSVVVAGWHLPAIRVETGGGSDGGSVDAGGPRFVYGIPDAARLRALAAREAGVYFLPGIDGFHRKELGVDLRAAGARPLKLTDPTAPSSAPAGATSPG